MGTEILDSLRAKLLREKLGDKLDWQKPTVFKSIGPYSPEYFESYEVGIRNIVDGCIAVLLDFSDPVIELLNNPDNENPHRVFGIWSDTQKGEILELRANWPPAWNGGGFGRPDYKADFDYWAKMPHFTILEACSLSIGVEPAHLDKTYAAGFASHHRKNNATQAEAFWMRRLDQFARQFPEVSYMDEIRPIKLFQWFDEVRLNFHPEFISIYSEPKTANATATPSQTLPQPDRREIDKIAQLFTVMAIDHLGYDPNAKRSPVPKEITDLAAEIGLDVSDDTVRKYLKLGSRFIPDDWKPSIR